MPHAHGVSGGRLYIRRNGQFIAVLPCVATFVGSIDASCHRFRPLDSRMRLAYFQVIVKRDVKWSGRSLDQNTVSSCRSRDDLEVHCHGHYSNSSGYVGYHWGWFHSDGLRDESDPTFSIKTFIVTKKDTPLFVGIAIPN